MKEYILVDKTGKMKAKARLPETPQTGSLILVHGLGTFRVERVMYAADSLDIHLQVQ